MSLRNFFQRKVESTMLGFSVTLPQLILTECLKIYNIM